MTPKTVASSLARRSEVVPLKIMLILKWRHVLYADSIPKGRPGRVGPEASRKSFREERFCLCKL